MKHLDTNTVSEILENCSDVRSLETYTKIQNDISPEKQEFQSLFNSFYRINGAGKKAEWKTAYYEIFANSTNESTYAEILQKLADRTGTCEASFASKMLATLNTEKPIVDRTVTEFLELERPSGELTERIAKAKENYSKIELWYKEYLATDEAKTVLSLFDSKFPEYTTISSVKKIDFILYWKGTTTN